jgi:signal transduction histidine kinase
MFDLDCVSKLTMSDVAPVSGYMFGKGVYFADMMSKVSCSSYSYSYHHMLNTSTVRQLLLFVVRIAPCLIAIAINSDVLL